MIREEVQRALGNILANSHASSSQQPLIDTPTISHRPLLASQPSNIAMSSSSSTLPEAMLPAILTNTLTHRQQQNRSTSQSFEGMPPLPQSVIDKIKNGEFLNFDLLLPNRSPVQSNDEYTFKVIGGSTPSVALVPNNQNKPKVTDFNSWMVAWNNFICSYGIFHPNRLQKLIRYQAIICDLASQYTFSAWSQYDQMFRYQLAYNPELSRHRIDDNLYRYVRGATLLSLCYLCKGLGHFASSCPNCPASSSASLQPFRPPSSNEVDIVQEAQNLSTSKPVTSTMITNNAHIPDVALRTSAGSALALTPVANVQSYIRHGDYCPLPSSVVSVLNINLFEYFLKDHPSPFLVQYISSGFREGFDIGFSGCPTSTRPRNLLSARQNPEPVSEAIRKELSRGHTSGPFDHSLIELFHCSPLGAVPKKDGSYRIILDLSSPRGLAVNEGISRENFSVKY